MLKLVKNLIKKHRVPFGQQVVQGMTVRGPPGDVKDDNSPLLTVVNQPRFVFSL